MGWKNNKTKFQILNRHFQFIYANIIVRDELDWMLTKVYAIPIEE